jgi:hypothetical protein
MSVHATDCRAQKAMLLNYRAFSKNEKGLRFERKPNEFE